MNKNPLDKAIESMNQAIISVSSETVINKEVTEIEPVKEEALIEPYSRKHKTGVKLFNSKLRANLVRLAKKYFFYKTICAYAGIWEQRLVEEVGRNEAFRLAFTHARACWIATQQKELESYAKDKRTSDWRAKQYLLTIADKEFSERKYLTEAVANQDAKILMLIKAEKLTIAQQQANIMLSGHIEPEKISLRPFQPVKKPKTETVINTRENGSSPSSE